MTTSERWPWTTGRALCTALLAAAMWLVSLLALRDTPAVQHVSNLGLAVVALAAGAAAVRQARRRAGASRRFWSLLGAAVLSWAGGQVVWTWYDSVLGTEPSVPSLADVGYLGLPPLAACALLSLPLVSTTLAGRVRAMLDGLIVATSLLLCNWLFVLGPIREASTGGPLELAVLLTYPVSDLVVITMVLSTWLRARQQLQSVGVPLLLVGSGLVAFAVSDSAFTLLTTTGAYESGSIADLGWFIGFALLLVAALDDDDRGRPGEAVLTQPTLSANLLPYAAVAVALVLSGHHYLVEGGDDHFTFWARNAILVLLVVRQIMSISDNQTLTRDLEQRVERRTAQLQASQQRFEALVQHSSDLVTVIDRVGTVLYQSRSSERVLGYSADWLTGQSLLDFVDGACVPDLLDALRHAPTDRAVVHTLRSTWRHADGRPCQVEVTITNLLDTPGVGGLVLNARDVTDRVALEEQLKRQAFVDSLTGLPNRALFRERLQRALDRRPGTTSTLTVFFLDLDGFKAVNDTLGHSAGDVLLVDVARRLRSVVRPTDTVARFGGDEFAVLIDESHGDAYASTLAQRIVERLRAPFQLGSEEVYIAASIGIAELDDPALGAEGLLRNADLAMYQAKARRTGSYSIYHPDMHAGLVERMRMEADLRRAVDNDQFFLQYQPIVDMGTGQILAVEALVRWQHPERGLVGPNEFIPLAEATGIIRQLGLWVLQEACTQTVRWRSTIPGAEDLRVSVNLSGQQILQHDLVEQVRQVLDRTGLPADRLVLEMTESVLIDNSEHTLAVLVALRGMGIRLALDDFGTGYSSLSYLHRFPIDTLKIDRSFVERLSTGGDAALIDTILALAESLHMETVAEGIEDLHQSRVLQRQGCRTGQGYHFSPPVLAPAIEALLREQRGVPGAGPTPVRPSSPVVALPLPSPVVALPRPSSVVALPLPSPAAGPAAGPVGARTAAHLVSSA